MARDYLDLDTASTMGLTVEDVRFNLLQASPIEFVAKLGDDEGLGAGSDRPTIIVTVPQPAR